MTVAASSEHSSKTSGAQTPVPASLDMPEHHCKEHSQSITLMLRNISCSYNQDDVERYLAEAGLSGLYGKLHLPMSPVRAANLGYAFIQLNSKEDVVRCTEALTGKPLGPAASTKRVQVCLAHVQDIRTVSRRSKQRLRAPRYHHL